MAGTVTRLTDVIVPERFTRYLTEASIRKTTLFRSNIIQMGNEKIRAFLAGGGTLLNIPFFQQLGGAMQAIQSNFTIQTNRVTTDKMVARRLLFGDGRSSEEIAAALSGEDPMQAITNMIDKWWDVQLQLALLASIRGIIDDNEDNDGGDLVNDLSTDGTVTSANRISSDAVIDTNQLMGDAADFTAIAMHSVPYNRLSKDNLITFVKDSAQDIGFGTYLGKTVIVNDQIYKEEQGDNWQYWSILFKGGAFMWDETAQGITVVETERVANKGEDELYTRRQFVLHPVGWKWSDNSVEDDMPTVTELQYAGNWDRVFNRKNCGLAVLKTNG